MDDGLETEHTFLVVLRSLAYQQSHNVSDDKTIVR